MDHEQLKKLIDQVDQSSLREFELNTPEVQVRMSKNEHRLPEPSRPQSAETNYVEENISRTESPQVAKEAALTDDVADETSPVEEQVEGHTVKSPIVGVAYLAPAPDEPVFKKAGDRVEKGDTLLIVEAMKVMNEIKSDVSGKVIKCLVEDGQAVEYDQPLFMIDTEE